jgi:hypothetical protein
MKRNPLKCLNVKIPTASLRKVDILEPTALRTLSSSNHLEGVSILTYWFDRPILSAKQLRWLGDIKSTIKSVFPEADIDVDCPEVLTEQSGVVYSLKELSVYWNKSHELLHGTIAMPQCMPPITPMVLSGKPAWNLSQSLYRYGIRLHYYDKLCIEYMKVASSRYNKFMPNGKVSLKIQEKTVYSVMTALKEKIDINPHDFKQKLSDEEYRLEKQKQAVHLQAYNRIIREENQAKVKTALESPLAYKKNGAINANSVAFLSELNIRTVRAILAS